MANNPYVNKVVFGSATLVDLTGTTATADKILSGYGAFGADGAWMDGTATGGGAGGNVWQDAQGYVHLDDEGTAPITVEALSVTQNGTYTAPTGKAYSPVTVNVSGGGGGASNVVGGTYTTGNGGSSETITLPYTGNGFPMQIVFSLAEGTQNSSGTAYNTIHQYGIVYFVYCKINTTAPTYAYDDSNTVSRYTVYKSSANTAHTLSGNSATMESYIFSPYSASGSGWDTVVQINSSTALSVYVSSASGTRGLMPNTAYNYSVVYSE